jgi:hypothetical protein
MGRSVRRVETGQSLSWSNFGIGVFHPDYVRSLSRGVGQLRSNLKGFPEIFSEKAGRGSRRFNSRPRPQNNFQRLRPCVRSGVAAGILPAVEPRLPARRKKPFKQPRNKVTKKTFSLCSFVTWLFQ